MTIKGTFRGRPALAGLCLITASAHLMLHETAWAQARDETITVTQPLNPGPYLLNFTGQPAAAAITLDLKLFDGSCENLRLANGTGGAIIIRNTSSPVGVPAKPDVAVALGQTSAPIPLCCPGDVGQWLFEVGDGPGFDVDAVLTVNVTCNQVQMRINANFGNLTSPQQAVAAAVMNEWAAKISDKLVKVTLTFNFEDLSGLRELLPNTEMIWPLDPVARASGPLAVADMFMEDANSKPTSARIRINSKFTWWEGVNDPGAGGWPDPTSYDMFSVLKHEVGHAIGFTINYTKFAAHVTPGPGALRTYNAGGVPTATLTGVADGTHTDATAHPGDLMNPTIGTCVRRQKSALDRDILNHGVWNSAKMIIIPAVSDLGLVVLLLLTAVAGVIVIRRSRRGDAAAA